MRLVRHRCIGGVCHELAPTAHRPAMLNIASGGLIRALPAVGGLADLRGAKQSLAVSDGQPLYCPA